MTDPTLMLLPREPTEAMLDAGGNCGGFEFDGETGTIYPAPIWRAMVSAFEASTSPALRLADRSRAEAQRDVAVAALEKIYDECRGFVIEQIAYMRTHAKDALADIVAIGESAPTQAPPVSAMERVDALIERVRVLMGADRIEMLAPWRTEMARAIEQAEREARAAALDASAEILEQRARGFASYGHSDAIFNGKILAEVLNASAHKIRALSTSIPPTGESPPSPVTDRLDEAARAIDHIKALGPPVKSPYEGRKSDWDTACDRCRGQVLAVRLNPPPTGESAYAASGWQPIETAPKLGLPGRSSRWLLLFGDGPGFAQCTFVGYWGINSSEDDEDEPCWLSAFYPSKPTRPTHWMPLPEPPTGESGQ